jgi:hypothetical protein
VVTDLEVFVQTHPIELDVTRDAREEQDGDSHDTFSLELSYQGRTLSYPWAQVAGAPEPDVTTVLTCLVAEAQTTGDEQLRALLGDDADELLVKRRQRAAVTNEQLQAASLAVRRTEPPYVTATQARNALIRRALKQGMRQVHVARIVGLTRARIAEIAKKR